jgi:glycosyltransferase involved in cell wall biosynthesis
MDGSGRENLNRPSLVASSKQNLVVLSEILPLGGTATFVLNICNGMKHSSKWSCVAAGLLGKGEIGEQIQSAGLEIISPSPSDLLHEDRIEAIYRQCSRLGARAVAAGLGSGSFDFLRYVPQGCLRIGMIQSDDECVYRLVETYLPWLDIVVGVSEEIRRKMSARLTDQKVSVYAQQYGVPMPEQIAGFPAEGPLRVLYLGRVIEEQKRVGLMERIIRRTLESGQDIHWTIAGDGPELPGMKDRFSDVPEKVRFLGAVPYRDVPDTIAGHEVYFLCSDFEGLPLSLLESMGHGLVPVVTDLTSGISEVVHENNGIRISPDDEAGYADALISLAEDRQRLTGLSAAAASEVSSSHSTQAMARRWEAMLDAHLSDTIPEWKTSCRAMAPMEVSHRWQFHPVLRPFRKLVKSLRG